MPNQVLIIEPQNELKFKVDFSGMFDHGYPTCMRLTNPTTDTVLFKIKTTAPKKYCVRPNSGVLEPNSSLDIAITPQPVYLDPNEKHKHKFMVQSIIAPEGKTNIDQVWKETSPDQLMDYKLKCVFETPGGAPANATESGDNTAQNEVTKKRVAVADDAKPPAKAAIVTKSAESELQKATSEVITLREEESKLRHENLQLKEQLLRLRQAAAGDAHTVRRRSYTPMKTESLPLMPWIAISFGMAIFGIIVGKFFM